MNNRLHQLAPLIAAGAAFLVYLLTQAPGLMYTDTGELAAAAATWGVAHPSGYPLMTLIAHLWTMLPWPSVIGGLNVLAALLTAAATAVLTMLLQLLAPRSPARHAKAPYLSISVALLVALCPLVWAQSTAFEVYCLNLLLVAATLYATLRSRTDTTLTWTMLAGMLYGLSLANHLSSIFLAPGLLVIWWKGAWDSRRMLALVLPAALVAASLYAVMAMRSATLPPVNWGWVHRGWEYFLYHVKGTQFGVWMFSDKEAVSRNLDVFFSETSRMLLWVGWIPVVVGIASLLRESRSVAGGLLLMLTGNLVISLGYAIPDIESYFLPSVLALAVLFAAGLHTLLRRLSAEREPLALVLPFIALVINYSSMDYRSHRAVEEYTQWTFDNLEPNAVLITRQWDHLCSAMWYHQVVEHQRPDVTIIDKELLRRTWYLHHLQHVYPESMKGAQAAIEDYMIWLEQFEGDEEYFKSRPENNRNIQARFVALLNTLLDSNATRPLYVTPEIMGEEEGFAQGYRAYPVGSVYRLSKDSALRVRTDAKHIPALEKSLRGRTERLDADLRERVMSVLASDAIYTAQFLRDTAEGRRLSKLAVDFNPKSPIATTLRQRIP